MAQSWYEVDTHGRAPYIISEHCGPDGLLPPEAWQLSEDKVRAIRGGAEALRAWRVRDFRLFEEAEEALRVEAEEQEAAEKAFHATASYDELVAFAAAELWHGPIAAKAWASGVLAQRRMRTHDGSPLERYGAARRSRPGAYPMERTSAPGVG